MAKFPRLLLLLFCCLLLRTPSLRAQGPDALGRPMDQLRTLSRDELDVVKVLTNQERAWNQGDLASYASGYKDSPDLLFIGQQVSRGYAQLLADYKKNYPSRESMGTLSFSELEPHVLDEHYAILIGRYHIERPKRAGGAADGLFSLVLEKTPKGWKIVVDHTT